MRKHRLSVLVAVLGLVSVRAGAQEAVNIADIRCVVVGMRLSGMAGSPDQSRGILLTLYYMGRLDGRVPQLDIEDLLIEESSKMTNSDYASEAKRCGIGLAEKGQQITKIGTDLIERGKKTVQPIPAH
jgi:hypothetical protein